MEENLRRSLLLSNGSWEFLWDRTLTACILATTILIVVWHIYKTFKREKLRFNIYTFSNNFFIKLHFHGMT